MAKLLPKCLWNHHGYITLKIQDHHASKLPVSAACCWTAALPPAGPSWCQHSHACQTLQGEWWMAMCMCNWGINHAPSLLEHSRHLQQTNHTLQASWSMQYLSDSMKHLRSYCRNLQNLVQNDDLKNKSDFKPNWSVIVSKSPKRISVFKYLNS